LKGEDNNFERCIPEVVALPINLQFSIKKNEDPLEFNFQILTLKENKSQT